MMISSSHHTREQFEHCLAAIRQAYVEILLLLNVPCLLYTSRCV